MNPGRRQNARWTATSWSQRGTFSNDVWSSASVTSKAARTRIVQERGADVGRDFLEKDDIRRFRSLEDMAEDEFGA